MIEFTGDQRPTILALGITLPIISILSVILRFEARRVKRVYLGADDWTILAALVCLNICSGYLLSFQS